MTQPAQVGSDLLYTYQASDHCKPQAVGQSRPAKVVRSWGTCYNVQVLTDGVNDFDDKRLVLHLTSIQISDCVAKGRLHWAGSPVESAPAETSAPEGAQSAPIADTGSENQPPGEDAPAVPEAPKPSPSDAPAKKKPGRPKKAK